jgi:hypothetical protein
MEPLNTALAIASWGWVCFLELTMEILFLYCLQVCFRLSNERLFFFISKYHFLQYERRNEKIDSSSYCSVQLALSIELI